MTVPVSERVNEGQPGQVNCTAIGAPLPNVMLTSDDTDVGISEVSHKNNVFNGSFSVTVIYSVSRISSNMQFTCLANNSYTHARAETPMMTYSKYQAMYINMYYGI